MTNVLTLFGGNPPFFGEVDVLAVNQPALFNGPTIDCNDWFGLRFYCQAKGDNLRLQFAWYSAPPGVDPNAYLMGVATWNIAPGGAPALAGLLHRGPYLVITSNDYVGGGTLDLVIQQTNAPAGAIGVTQGLLAVAPPATPIGAGATNTAPLVVPYTGPAHLHFATTAVAWEISVTAEVAPTQIYPVFQADNASVLGGKRVEADLLIPPDIMTILVTNNDVGPQTYEYTLLTPSVSN